MNHKLNKGISLLFVVILWLVIMLGSRTWAMCTDNNVENTKKVVMMIGKKEILDQEIIYENKQIVCEIAWEKMNDQSTGWVIETGYRSNAESEWKISWYTITYDEQLEGWKCVWDEEGCYYIRVFGEPDHLVAEQVAVIDRECPKLTIDSSVYEEKENIIYLHQTDAEPVFRFFIEDTYWGEEGYSGNVHMKMIEKNRVDTSRDVKLSSGIKTDSGFLYQVDEVLEDGWYECEFEVSDLAGNSLKDNKQITVVIDTAKPEIQVRPDQIDIWYGPDEAIGYYVDVKDILKNENCSGLSKIRYILVGSNQSKVYEWQQFESKEQRTQWQGQLKIDVNSLPEDIYGIYFEAVDHCQGIIQSKIYALRVDRQSPKTELRILNTEGTRKGYYKEPVVIELIMKDDCPDINNRPVITGTSEQIFEKWVQKDQAYQAVLKFEQDGEYDIRWQAQDRFGNKAEEKTFHFIVDTTKPIIRIDGPEETVLTKGGCTNKQTLTVIIEEVNPDTQLQTIAVVKNGIEESVDFEWEDCANGNQAFIDNLEDGDYQITVECIDLADNKQVLKTADFIVDTTKPLIKINGVKPDTAYGEGIEADIYCFDQYLNENKTNVFLEDRLTGKIMTQNDNQLYNIDEEPWWKKRISVVNDGLYTLTVVAEDYAGNRSVTKSMFSVNREGSAFGLAESTMALFKKGITNHRQNLDFYETNLDYLQEISISCSRDGMLMDWHEGEDYQIFEDGNEVSWKRYTYHINEDCFVEDGLYDFQIYTKDEAGNQKLVPNAGMLYRFILDTAAPEVEISTIGLNKYKIECKDSVGVGHIKVLSDGNLYREWSGNEVVYEDELMLDEKLKEKTMNIYVSDLAGNETMKIIEPQKTVQDTEQSEKHMVESYSIQSAGTNAQDTKEGETSRYMLFFASIVVVVIAGIFYIVKRNDD